VDVSIYRKAVKSLSVKLLTALFNFSIALILARSLGADEYGYYAYAIALVMILTVPAQFGFPSLVVKEVSRSVAKGDVFYLDNFWSWAKSCSLIISIIVFLLSEVAAYSFIRNDYQYSVVAVALALIPLIAMLSLYSAYLRGLKKIILGQFFEPLLRFVFFFVFIGLVVFFLENETDSVRSVELHVLAGFISAFSLFLVTKKIKAKFNKDVIQSEPFLRKVMWLTVTPMAITASVQVLNANLDVLVVDYFLDKGSVGVYKITVQVTLLLAFGLQAINLILAPYFSSLYQDRDFQKLQNYSRISARLSFLFSLLAAIPLMLYSSDILAFLFGDMYGEGAVALVYLLIGQMVNAYFGSVGVLLNMSGNHKFVAKSSAFSLLMNLTLSLSLVPKWGIEGAAIATAAALVFWNISLNIYARKKLGISTAAAIF